MTELLNIAREWFFNLSSEYGINPIIFGSIYIGGIPFFAASLAWLVRNHKNSKSLVLPALSATCFFISAYIYLIIAGQNVPWWVYGVVLIVVLYGGWTTYNRIRKKVKKLKE